VSPQYPTGIRTPNRPSRSELPQLWSLCDAVSNQTRHGVKEIYTWDNFYENAEATSKLDARRVHEACSILGTHKYQTLEWPGAWHIYTYSRNFGRFQGLIPLRVVYRGTKPLHNTVLRSTAQRKVATTALKNSVTWEIRKSAADRSVSLAASCQPASRVTQLFGADSKISTN
jgi:hypothetical protein